MTYASGSFHLMFILAEHLKGTIYISCFFYYLVTRAVINISGTDGVLFKKNIMFSHLFIVPNVPQYFEMFLYQLPIYFYLLLSCSHVNVMTRKTIWPCVH